MPRPEKPLDPEDGIEARFSLSLRALRERAGSPSYRVMEARPGVHYSASVLSEAASGKKLPPWEVVKAYVAACEGDPCEPALRHWRAQWELCQQELASPGSVVRAAVIRGDASVIPSRRVRWRTALAALVGAVGAGLAAVFLASGVTNPMPPTTELQLALSCSYESSSGNGTSVPVGPVQLNGVRSENSYLVTVPSGGNVTIDCTASFDLPHVPDQDTLAIFTARTAFPDGAPDDVTFEMASSSGGQSGPRVRLGPGTTRPQSVFTTLSKPPGEERVAFTITIYAMGPSSDGKPRTIALLDPRVIHKPGG